VTNTIASNNPNLDDRFKPGKTSRNLTMVDDSRTIYDMSHLIYDAQQPGYDPYANDNINPNSEQTTEDAMKEIYGSLTDKFNPNTFNLNTDSQQVLYSFAKPKGNPDDAEFGMSNGIIAYNGDILYAAMGSGIDEWEDT
jgi:hypothetical protein